MVRKTHPFRAKRFWSCQQYSQLAILPDVLDDFPGISIWLFLNKFPILDPLPRNKFYLDVAFNNVPILFDKGII